MKFFKNVKAETPTEKLYPWVSVNLSHIIIKNLSIFLSHGLRNFINLIWFKDKWCIQKEVKGIAYGLSLFQYFYPLPTHILEFSIS